MASRKKVVLWALVFGIAAFSIAWLVLTNAYIERNGKSSGPIIGDLGGVPVEIPRKFAFIVEYDKDPHFMEKDSSPTPKRTYQSRLRGFAFEVRYPDMASVDMRTEAEKDIFTTTWMRVLTFSGEDYGSTGDEVLDIRKNRYLDTKKKCYGKCFIYESLPDKTYGLTGYTPTGSGVDVALREVNGGVGIDYNDRNIYFYEDDTGRVTTFIECSNVTHAAAPCSQYFNLSPVMKTRVKISYRKGLLPHWKEIQQSVTDLIYGFKADLKSPAKSN